MNFLWLVQGIVVGCLAALASMLLVWLPAGGLKGGAALLLITSAVTTASIASLLLGIVMVGVVLLSSKLRSEELLIINMNVTM